ncbi:MAG: GC-type dockerin domain-anchored protein [Phycisphaerales bacterium]
MKSRCLASGFGAFVAVGVGHGLALAQPFAIDADFSEWDSVPVALTDPSGDALGLFDVTHVRGVAAGTVVYLEFDATNVINISTIPGVNQEVRIQFELPAIGRTVEVRLGGTNSMTATNPTQVFTWNTGPLIAQPSFASDRFELRTDLAIAGASAGDMVNITFGGASASDSTTPPIALTLGGDGPVLHEGSTDRAPCADFRLASLNTLNTGFQDQTPGLLRVVDSVDADVYCFVEEYGGSATAVMNVLNSIDPTENGLPWNVRKNNDCVIASQHTLVSAPSYDNSYVAAVVDMGSPARSVLVLAIHPKCCGSIGSSEDLRRIEQAGFMLQTIDEVRNALPASPLFPYRDAPVIVAGDWNLVGSRTPLDMLTDPSLPGVEWLHIPKIGADDATTWQANSAGTAYPPGILDYIVFSADKLGVLNRFVLDSRLLSPSQLAALGLQAGDSGASDHDMLVADFAFPSPADLAPPFGSLDFSDVLAFLVAFGSGATEADLAPPLGVFDFSDVLAFLQAFGGACE